jgi:flavin reductase (DIM6/NTAB) family NADH-FMN oxidoreductase RutF
MHVRSESPILYFGTPVVLISTINEDGTPNLSPMSSAWWLGWRCMLGLDASSKTTQNIKRTGECVLNLPSADMVAAVDAIARTTGSDPMPDAKQMRGYRTERQKFETAGLTPVPSESVTPPRVAECPVQMEATVTKIGDLSEGDAVFSGFLNTVQVSIERLHLDETIIKDGNPDRVDPDKWRPLIMSFAQFYGLTDGKLRRSELAAIPESSYPRAGGEHATGGIALPAA